MSFTIYTLHEEDFQLNFKFCSFANGKFAKLKFRLVYFKKSLNLTVYMTEIKKSKFANIPFCEFDQFEPGRKIYFHVCFHSLELVPIVLVVLGVEECF